MSIRTIPAKLLYDCDVCGRQNIEPITGFIVDMGSTGDVRKSLVFTVELVVSYANDLHICKDCLDRALEKAGRI